MADSCVAAGIEDSGDVNVATGIGDLNLRRPNAASVSYRQAQHVAGSEADVAPVGSDDAGVFHCRGCKVKRSQADPDGVAVFSQPYFVSGHQKD